MIALEGKPLTAADLEALAARWIDKDTAKAQMLRRVASLDGKALIAANGRGDYSGLLIPYVWPGTEHIREYRLRRDHPEVKDGKPNRKYLSPPGRGGMLYFPVGTDPAWLGDPKLPAIITEGEFKTLALARAARNGSGNPAFLAVGLGGVWNWRDRSGKTNDADGARVDEPAPIADLSRLVWDEREVLILFDADLEGNGSVESARFCLTRELRSRGARVRWFRWPDSRPPEAKGVDDLLAAIGPEKVLPLIEAAFQSVDGEPDLIRHHFADSGNAERIVALYGANLRYCFAFRRWLVWNGKRWAPDDSGSALKLAKRTMVEFLDQAIEAKNEAAEKFARGCLDAYRLQSALGLAQPELPITPQELDANPMLLNFTNGTVELDTGTLRPHRRSDFITKLVGFAYRPEAACPHWLQFLAEIMGAHADASEDELRRVDELIEFLQLGLGYSITGDASEKAVFVAHGSGDNGKTTMLSTVRDLVREYAATVGLDLLTAKDDSNNVAAARAKLLGARLAVSSETEEGQRLSAARLKRICQGPGGEIEACRKYENPITFRETHKLWIDANHRPELPATDAAVWNRLRLIPFDVVIPKERQDPALAAKLRAEAEGILAWLVMGARLWHERRLPRSQVVAAATQGWREELDRLGAYLEENTEKATDKEAWLLNKVIYEDYKGWCDGNGERALAQPKFAAQMETMGYRKTRRNKGNIWEGIRLKKPSPSPVTTEGTAEV